jgi:hypothetical protein
LFHFYSLPLTKLFMKKNVLLLVLFSCWTFIHAQTVPGGGCSNEDCYNSVLNISTGYDHSTSSYVNPLAAEPTWELVTVPGSSGIVLPSTPWVIAPVSPWSSFPNAKWISPFQNSIYGVNNPPPDLPFGFRNCFCLCQQTTVHIKFDMLVDDGAEVYVDGTLIATAMAGWQFLWPNRLIVDTFITLPAGNHCLRVDLRNMGGGLMGVAIEGTISGANLLSSRCCKGTGKICGTKVNDLNCDGVVDASVDPGIAGWTINLYDNLGNLVGTRVTDANGNYCFDPLAPGTYTVAEVAQPGWTQTYPASGTYTVNVTPGSAFTAVFGNCNRPPSDPCDVNIGFDYEIINCGARFYAGLPAGLPASTKIISTEWTFGDGYSSTELNPMHFYKNPGVYVVCLTVTLLDEARGICCRLTKCYEIYIENECKDGCVIDAYIDAKLRTHESCIYDFSGIIAGTGTPITNWFWDFGDGTTGTGSTISHQFPAPGVYKVCLVVFGFSADNECCYRKVCIDVDVTCMPKAGSASDPKKVIVNPGQRKDGVGRADAPVNAAPGVKSTDQNVIVLNQNVPNPFAESTVITYNIPVKFNKAQLLFTTSGGKTVRVVDIKAGGEGSLKIVADDLSTGVYMYSLVVDGKVIESKSMVKH